MKDEFREKHRMHRQMQSPEELMKKSFAIKKRLFADTDFKGAEKILFYVSRMDEVQTRQMIHEALAMGKIVYIPKTDLREHKIQAIQIESLDNLVEGNYGIHEPEEGKEISAQELDLVVVPGIVFDEFGNRIGSGKGFFDRFLANAGKAKKIGIAFECNIVKKIEAEQHDIAMDKIITEERTISPKA